MLLSLSAALTLSASEPTPVPPSAVFVNMPMVEQVQCDKWRGTAFIAGHSYISADHVTSGDHCKIAGREIHSVAEGDLDFSISDGGLVPGAGYKINCDGFQANETYWAIGYAKGLPVQRSIALTGTGEHAIPSGLAVLIGYPTVIPGMSGGPIINSKAEVVGIVNKYHLLFPLSWSRELKDTSLCRGDPQ